MAYQTTFGNTIWAGAADGCYSHADTKEKLVAATKETQPGKIVAINADGDVESPAGTLGTKVLHVVLERGSHVGGDVTDVFGAGEQVEIAFPRSGELFRGLVESTDTTEEGVVFAANSNGYFVPAASATNVTRTFFECQVTTAASTADRLVLFKKI